MVTMNPNKVILKVQYIRPCQQTSCLLKHRLAKALDQNGTRDQGTQATCNEREAKDIACKPHGRTSSANLLEMQVVVLVYIALQEEIAKLYQTDVMTNLILNENF